MILGLDRFKSYKILKFIFVGGSTFLGQSFLYLILSRYILNYIDRFYSYILALIFAVIYNYLMHKYWTFNKKDKLIRNTFYKYLLVLFLSFLLNNTIFYIGYNVLGIYDLFIILFAGFVTPFFTYYAHEFYTFY